MISGPALFGALRQYRLVDEDQLDRLESELFDLKSDALKLVEELRERGVLTGYQVGRLLENEASTLSIGQHVVLDKLGEGGMGQVLKARHRLLRRVDAIKVIRPECLTSQQAVGRFFREAQAVASLRHPNIIQAYDANKEGDRHYIVMEFVPGTDLGKLVQQHGPLPIGVACDFIRQAALGLQHAHEKKGLVHRDIKPTNLMLAVEDRAVKVLDLGLAQLRSANLDADMSEGGPKTPQGMLMGTPDFMAPEQAEDSSSVDIRADIYSLGCSLYQLLAGTVPYPGGSLVDKLMRHNSQPPPPLRTTRPEVPSEVVAIVERMMAKKAADRFPEPAEVAVALAPYSWLPKGELFTGTARGAGGSPSDMIPQTLQEPGSGFSGPRTSPLSSPSMGKTAPLTLDSPRTQAPNDATLNVGASTIITPSTSAPVASPTVPPIAEVSRGKKNLAVGVLAGFLIAGVAAFVVMNREKEREPGPPVVKNTNDPTKDGKKTDKVGDKVIDKVVDKKDDVKPALDVGKDKDKDGKKPDDRKPDDRKPSDKPPPDPRKDEPGIAKGLPSTIMVEVVSKEGQTGTQPKGSHTGRQGNWQRVETLAKLPVRAQQNITGASFSPDGTRAAVLSGTTITVYDTMRPEKPEIVEPLAVWRPQNLSGDAVVHSIGFAPDGKDLVWLTVNTTDEKVKGKVLPLAEYETLVRSDGKKMSRFYLDEAKYRERRPIFGTRGFAFSPDGKFLATATNSRLMRWEVPPLGASVDAPPSSRLDDQAECLASSPDGKTVVLGCASRRLSLYPMDKDTEIPLFEFKDHGATPRALSFVGDRHIVSGDSRGQVLVWEVPTDAGKEPKKSVPAENPHKDEITCVAAAPKEGYYATGSRDGWIRVGKLNSEKAILVDQIEGEEVRALAFRGSQLLALTDKQLLRVELGLPPSPVLVKTDEGDAVGRGIAKGKK